MAGCNQNQMTSTFTLYHQREDKVAPKHVLSYLFNILFISYYIIGRMPKTCQHVIHVIAQHLIF